MMTWWHYLLLVNLYLVLFFGFYKAFLRKETFFQLNRIYLVAASLLSFLIPLIKSDWLRQLFITQQVHQTIYAAVNPGLIYQVKPVENSTLTLGHIFTIIYITGAAILSFRLLYQLFLLKNLGNGAGTQAFSFFKKIHVDKSLPNQQTIIEHEEVHISQWHSADVLLIEVVMIINWFNPIVYVYRRAIKHVHEFIADRKAIATGTSKADYAMMLLSQTFGADAHQLTNNFFNHSLLKQRIMMLDQNDSNRRALLKYGLSAPLFAAMLIFSSATVNQSKLIGIINKKTEQAFSINATQIRHRLSGAKNDLTIAGTFKTVATHQINPVILKSRLRPKSDTDFNDTLYGRSLASGSTGINPDFPGGQAAFSQFLREHIHYPDKAKENHTSGSVAIQFVVEKDGSLSNIKPVDDPGDGLAVEATRVMAMSPRWNPAVQNGKTVRMAYTVPVNFALQDNPDQITDTASNGLKPKRQMSFTFRSRGDTLNTGADRTDRQYASGEIEPRHDPLILLNGKALSKEELKQLRPETIESIYVVKGEQAKQYGEKAQNGAIVIITKEVKKL